MARKAPTEEQKQKAAERRERFRRLAKAVADMSDAQREELVARCGAIVTCEGRPLSIHNSCLVLTQLPTASMVGGFHQWIAAGRSVKKGESGLSIWVPTAGKRGESKPAGDTPKGEGESDGARPGFVMGTVFDVSQTQEIEAKVAATN